MPREVGGIQYPCGRLSVHLRDRTGRGCDDATGTIVVREVDGRDWYDGECRCGEDVVSFHVPYTFDSDPL